MRLVKCLRNLARALDWAKDPDPSHWKTINGAKVHLDENGNYDGGAGGRFNGKHHYGSGYKGKQPAPPRRSAIMKNPANSIKTQAEPPRPKTTRRKGTISDRFIDFIKYQISIDLSKYRDREYERRGHVNILIQQMPKKEKMEFYRFASQHKDDFTVLENGGLGIAIVPKKDGRWNK